MTAPGALAPVVRSWFLPTAAASAASPSPLPAAAVGTPGPFRRRRLSRQRHGPGGGGGGGVVFLSAPPASANATGGSNGYTDTVHDSYGATPGQPGIVDTAHVITETPGTQSGAYCGSADLSVTNSGSPALVFAGNTITYTQSVANAGPLDALNAVFSESIPSGTTFQSISSLAGWTCVTPAVGGTGTITCTNPDFATNASGTFTVAVLVLAADAYGTEIVDVDNIASSTSDPNLANNTAIATNTVTTATQADLAVTNTVSSPTVTAGSNFTMSSVVTNNGPVAASGLIFTESMASNAAGSISATFVSVTAPGWTCLPPGGTPVTITCTLSTLGVGGTAGTIAIVETAPSVRLPVQFSPPRPTSPPRLRIPITATTTLSPRRWSPPPARWTSLCPVRLLRIP